MRGVFKGLRNDATVLVRLRSRKTGMVVSQPKSYSSGVRGGYAGDSARDGAMRDYAKVVPTFWTGKTGKALRAKGNETLIVGMYLMTAPHSNMLGLYYLPLIYIAHETGLGIEGASKGLQGAIEAGFCSFDEASEMVWVHEMAFFQIATELKPADKRCMGIQKDFDNLPNNPFSEAFLSKYKAAFHLLDARAIEAPSKPRTKPLRSQEHEQEQEQEQEKNSRVAAVADSTSKTISIKDLVSEGVEKQKAADWLVLRKAKRLPLTLSAWIDTKAEGEKVGLTPADTVAHAVSCNWAGFKASWYAKDNGSPMYSGGIFAGAI